MKRIVATFLFIAAPIILIISFQNCGGKGASAADASTGVKMTCVPEGQPCLSYKMSLANLSSTKGAMSVLIQGSVDQGVLNNTTFSTNCTKINGSTAYCPFNTTASGTITSDSTTTTVKGDGRSLTVSVFTSDNIQSQKYGDLSKLSNQESELCFSSDGADYWDGDVIPLEWLTSCSGN